MLNQDTLSQQEKNLIRLANFRLMDDTFMSEALNEANDAVALILKNNPIETIAQCTGLSLEEVESLRKEMLVNA